MEYDNLSNVTDIIFDKDFNTELDDKIVNSIININTITLGINYNKGLLLLFYKYPDIIIKWKDISILTIGYNELYNEYHNYISNIGSCLISSFKVYYGNNLIYDSGIDSSEPVKDKQIVQGMINGMPLIKSNPKWKLDKTVKPKIYTNNNNKRRYNMINNRRHRYNRIYNSSRRWK
jgi:hypothetical protein